jgi:ATP-dependent protease ClpP protease subunit
MEILETRKLEEQIRQLELENWQKERENNLIGKSPTSEGRFSYFGAVEEEGVAHLIAKLDIWSLNHPGQPITLTINSPGGNVFDGFALCDFLEMLKKRGHKIITLGIGMQASMGGILLQAGDERIMTKRSWFHIHEVQGLSHGSYSQREDDMKLNSRLQEQALDLLCSKSKMTKTGIKKKWKYKDWWMDADDALAAGFIDRIES